MNPMKIDNGPEGLIISLDRWTWVFDKDGHLLEVRKVPGTEIDDVYTSDQAEAQCGVSWIVDLRLGLAVFGFAFGVILLALWVFR